MHLEEFYPLQGTFRPGEPIKVRVRIAELEPGCQLRLSYWHLQHKLAETTVEIQSEGQRQLDLAWKPGAEIPRGYGIEAELVDKAGRVLDRKSSAADVLASWLQHPRYGFLSDFGPDRQDLESVFTFLTKLHINGLQFYDWMYRHDQLVSPEKEYVDPLDRRLSLKTIRACLRQADQHGMAAMAYAAIYAASRSFWQAHGDWALFDGKGEPIPFADGFLGLMDPTDGSAWANHLHEELDRVTETLDFAGIHLDQYGEPKLAFDQRGVRVDLPQAFNDFMRRRKQKNSAETVTFNAVGGWPLEDLSRAPLDFQYTEIWPPMTSYQQIIDLLLAARQRRPSTGLVIAAYLPVEAKANILLLEALCFAIGATRIEVGEGGRYLVDPYFPNHRPIDRELMDHIRRYYDFSVRYGDLLGPLIQTVDSPLPGMPAGLIGIQRQAQGWRVLNLINFSGLKEPQWNEPHPWPGTVEAETIMVPAPATEIRNVWLASPDRQDPALVQVDWQLQGQRLAIQVPSIDLWTMIALELEGNIGYDRSH